MKTRFALIAIGSSLLLGTTPLPAQNTGTNSLPLNQTVKYQLALENDRTLGELALLPPGLKEKLQLTDEQRGELKPIEDDFAKTSREYQAANQPRIDAAQEANRQARASKDAAKIQAARKQLLQFFEAWGVMDPDTIRGRRKLSALLFS